MRNSSALLSCKFMDIAPESQELLAASTADAWSPPPPGAFQGAPREHHQEGCPSFSRHSSRAWAQRRLRVCRWSRIFYRAAHVEATACWGEPGTFPGPPRGQHQGGRVILSSLQHSVKNGLSIKCWGEPGLMGGALMGVQKSERRRRRRRRK